MVQTDLGPGSTKDSDEIENIFFNDQENYRIRKDKMKTSGVIERSEVQVPRPIVVNSQMGFPVLQNIGKPSNQDVDEAKQVLDFNGLDSEELSEAMDEIRSLISEKNIKYLQSLKFDVIKPSDYESGEYDSTQKRLQDIPIESDSEYYTIDGKMVVTEDTAKSRILKVWEDCEFGNVVVNEMPSEFKIRLIDELLAHFDNELFQSKKPTSFFTLDTLADVRLIDFFFLLNRTLSSIATTIELFAPCGNQLWNTYSCPKL